MEPYDTNHISAREFERWIKSDSEWKDALMEELRDHRKETREHGERLAVLHALQDRTENAEGSAKTAKRVTYITAIVVGVIQAFQLAFSK